ncbi:MAG TPA: amino acid permease [Bryobacteraceae bacterium]|nr:amino acid permease [Bryobacteraceae bacterium]HXR78155.1 amino acid permease [Bryobacteraceae bacterium]
MPANDSHDLSRFGYTQELFRDMGGFSNFAISFSIISILTGAVTLYGYGLQMGGPLEMTLGWPIATLFTLTIGISMAELCSAYPTSGAMYHWASALGGPGAGWFVAWLSIVGLIAAEAGIDYSCAQFMLPFFRVAVSPRNIFIAFALTLVIHGLLNQYGVKLVARLNDISVTVHIVGVLAIVVGVFWFAPLQPVGFLLTPSPAASIKAPFVWLFLLGLLQAQWTYTGFEASAHMCEETSNARRSAPWGIVLSVAVSGIAGYALLLALTFAIQSVPGVLAAKDAQGNTIPAAIAILQTALGARIGNGLAALASMAMWFCGLSCVTSASRAVYALARDGGMPKPKFFARVNPKHGTPGPAIWAVVVATIVAMAWSGAIPVVTSLSTVALYLAYIIPVILGLRARKHVPSWTESAVWSAGKWGRTLNWCAITYAIFICFVLIMPPNELAGKTLAGVVAILTLIYWLNVRRKFRGPEWARQAAVVPAGQPPAGAPK